MGKIKNSRALIDSLEAGDLISLSGTPRLVRKVKHCTVRHGKAKGQKYLYFAKVKRSQYPSCYVGYEIGTLEQIFDGLIKRNVPLCTTLTSVRVQQAILAGVDEIDFEKSRAIITQEESVGLVY